MAAKAEAAAEAGARPVIEADSGGRRYKVAADLMDRLVPIEAIQAHPANPRQGDVGAISVSLDAFGQYAPIVVQRATGSIVKGNHTWFAARANGWTHIAAVYTDLDDAGALEILLVDNRASDLGSYDEKALLDLLQQFDEDGLRNLGYDYDDLDALAANVGEVRSEDKDALPDINDLAESYLNNTIRQMALHFPQAEFAPFLARLDRAMVVTGAPTHTDAVLALLDAWEAAQPDLPPLAEQEPDAAEEA